MAYGSGIGDRIPCAHRSQNRLLASALAWSDTNESACAQRALSSSWSGRYESWRWPIELQ